LHPEGEFERLDAGFEVRVIRAGLLVLAIELAEEVELFPLGGGGD
jgi:hypothetical protein